MEDQSEVQAGGRAAGPTAVSPVHPGEMAALIAAKDWSLTPLGPMDKWSSSLRMMTRFLLANRFPLLLWWGPDHISIYNDAYRPILGTKHPRALGQPVRECWSEIWHILEPLIQSPFQGGPSTWSEDFELEIRRRGFLEETHFTVAYSPVPDETARGGIGGVLATVHEITPQVLSERRGALLRDLSARSAEAKTAEEACAITADVFLRHAKDVPFALIYLIDGDGEARLAGAAGLPVDGLASSAQVKVAKGLEDEKGWPLARVLHTERSEVVRDVAARFEVPWPDPSQQALVLPIRSNLAHRMAGVLVAGTSARLELDRSYRAFFDLAVSQLAAAIGNARAYEEERHRTLALEELDRAKTVFFSNVSHEFRTPLTLMLGHIVDGLEDASDPLSQGQRARLETAERNGLRLLKLVNSLLDFSRIEAGRIEASYEATDLSALTSEIASTFRSLVERAGLGLILDCRPLAQPVFVDREMWEKIVLNLLSNAFKFTFEGEIAVRVEADASFARLVVRDTGTGIDEEHLPHIFERFYRVQGARGRTYEGTGIGLALVRELARLHGGRVSVSSEVNRGTTFTVELPLGSAHLPKRRLVEPARTRASTAVRATTFVEEAAGWVRGGTEDALGLEPSPLAVTVEGPCSTTLLVADDNGDMRAYLQRLLRPLAVVETAADGVEALASIRRRLPDLVLADVMMPRLDGFGLVQALRGDERTRTLPIVLLSARAGGEASVEGMNAGADDYIVKPFAARELVARVRSQLELSRLRREHAEELRASEERFRALVTTSSDAVYRMSPDFSEMRYLRGRPFLADMELPSRSWLEKYVYPEDQPRVLAAIRTAVRDRSTFALEHRVLRADGSVGWAFSRAVPLRDANGDIAEWFGAASDITDRKLAEEALRKANSELAETDRRKNEFLAVLSHELRNPLAPIRNGTHILERAVPGSDQARRALVVINRQVRQLSRLVDDLLDLTRISRNKIQLQLELLDLNEIVRRTLDDHRSLFEGADVELEFEPAPKPLFVQADSNRLAQVVGNLLQNAIKFTPGGGRATVTVSADGEEKAAVRVADTGAGMTPDLVSRLFQPFMQEESGLVRTKGGLGLGLALAKALVRQHGGDITAHSAGPGQGAEFMVTLPLVAGASLPRVEEAETVLKRRTILLIEDNLDAAESLAELLALAGHQVELASDGPEGLAKAHELRPDLVLCDIGLPGMDGYEVAQTLRADEALRGTYLVALSGYALPQDIERARYAGFDSHLAKPPSLDRLNDLLRDLAGPSERAGGRPDFHDAGASPDVAE